MDKEAKRVRSSEGQGLLEATYRLRKQKFRQRPYCVECTGSLPNSEVKPRKARIVLGWVTAREVLRVLLTFFAWVGGNATRIKHFR